MVRVRPVAACGSRVFGVAAIKTSLVMSPLRPLPNPALVKAAIAKAASHGIVLPLCGSHYPAANLVA